MSNFISIIITNTLVLVIFCYSFFFYFFPRSSILLLVASFFSCFVLFFKRMRITLAHTIFYCFCLLILFRGNFVQDDSLRAYSILFFSSCFLYFVFVVLNEWYEHAFLIIIVFGGIHVVSTLYAFALPDSFQEIIFNRLPAFFRTTVVPLRGIQGITNQTALNAFYISIFISVFVVFLFSSFRYRGPAIFFLIFAIFALLLTFKRAFLIANLSAVLALALTKAPTLAKFIKKFLLSAFVLLVFAVGVCSFFPESVSLFMRLDSGSSGRTELYGIAFAMINESPIWGHGFRAYAAKYGIAVHNIYLQLWCDLGVVGLLFFLCFVFLNLNRIVKSIKSSKKFYNNYLIRPLYWSLYVQVFFLIYGFFGNPTEDFFIFVIYILASSIPYSVYYGNSFRRFKLLKREAV